MRKFGEFTIGLSTVRKTNGVMLGSPIGESSVIWRGQNMDIYGQYFNVGGYGGYRVYPIYGWLQKSLLQGGWIGAQSRGQHPAGTIRGVYTRYRRGLPEAVERVAWPAVTMDTNHIYTYAKLTKENVESLFVDSPILRPAIHIKIGVLPWIELDIYDGYWPGMAGFEDLQGFIGLQGSFAQMTRLHPEPVPYSPPLFYCYVWAGESGTEPDFEPFEKYTLHHVEKRNAEIHPPDGTRVYKGFPVYITTYPTKKNAILTNFKIDSPTPTVPETEYLPDALYLPPEGEKGITIPTYSPGLAEVNFVAQGDVYVSAIADGEIIEGGMPMDIQMFTTDCLVEPGSWELGESNLPDEITATISEDGLVHFNLTLDYWQGIVGNKYWQEVIFNGYSQTLTKKLILTVADVPAYGTVWDAVGRVGSTAIVDILYTTAGDIFIATLDKIYKTDDTLATFTEMTLSGSLVIAFGGLAEASDNRIVAMDKQYMWLFDGTDTFTQTTKTNPGRYWNTGYRVTANPASSYVFLHGTNSLGNSARVNLYDLDTDTLIGTYTVYAISAATVKGNGIYQDGHWVFLAGGNYQGIGKLDDEGNWTNPVADEASYATGKLFTENATGRIYWLNNSTNEELSIRYSEDQGVTWSTAEVVEWTPIPNGVNCALGLMKAGYGLMGNSSKIYRTTDGFTTYTDVKTTDGTVNVFCTIAKGVLLCGTSGTTTNLYKSEA